MKKKENENEKKLMPEERRAIKKKKKREAYRAEKLERKIYMNESKSNRFMRKHRKLAYSITAAAVAILVFLSVFLLNTGAFLADSYRFVNYDKYVSLAKTDKLNYDPAQLKISDDDVDAEIEKRVEEAGAEYNKDFIKKDSNGKYDNKKDYFKSVKSDLKKSAESSVEDQLLIEYLGKCKVKKYPEKQLSTEKKAAEEQFESMASMYETGTSDMPVYEAFGMTEESYKDYLKDYAKEAVKEKLVVNSFSKKKGIRVSASEYKDYLKKEQKRYGVTDKEFEQQYGMSFKKYMNENGGKYYALRQEVVKYLLDNAKTAPADKDKVDKSEAAGEAAVSTDEE